MNINFIYFFKCPFLFTCMSSYGYSSSAYGPRLLGSRLRRSKFGTKNTIFKALIIHGHILQLCTPYLPPPMSPHHPFQLLPPGGVPLVTFSLGLFVRQWYMYQEWLISLYDTSLYNNIFHYLSWIISDFTSNNWLSTSRWEDKVTVH